MSARDKAAVVAAAAGVAFAGMTMLEPHLPNQPANTPAQIQENRRDQSVEDLNDTDDAQKDRHREDGNALQDANERDKLRPGEHRPPPEPSIPKFRFFPK